MVGITAPLHGDDGVNLKLPKQSSPWSSLLRYPIHERVDVRRRKPFQLGRIRFEAFTVEHSILAPAVGYRIVAGPASDSTAWPTLRVETPATHASCTTETSACSERRQTQGRTGSNCRA